MTLRRFSSCQNEMTAAFCGGGCSSFFMLKLGEAFGMRSLKCGLGGEHLCQGFQDYSLSLFRELAEFLYKSNFVYGANLVQDDLSLDSFKGALHSGGIDFSFGSHRCNNDRRDVMIHFIGRNHYAGSCLSNFLTLGGIQGNQEHIETIYFHSHSVLSQSELNSSISVGMVSSPCMAIDLNASVHPART